MAHATPVAWVKTTRTYAEPEADQKALDRSASLPVHAARHLLEKSVALLFQHPAGDLRMLEGRGRATGDLPAGQAYLRKIQAR
jgi:hypothetical protein